MQDEEVGSALVGDVAQDEEEPPFRFLLGGSWGRETLHQTSSDRTDSQICR